MLCSAISPVPAQSKTSINTYKRMSLRPDTSFRELQQSLGILPLVSGTDPRGDPKLVTKNKMTIY